MYVTISVEANISTLFIALMGFPRIRTIVALGLLTQPRKESLAVSDSAQVFAISWS